jgi:mono/diheme cytochrome c family protein
MAAVIGRAVLAASLGLGLGLRLPAQEAGLASEARAILAERCHKCHGAEKQKGGLRLDRRAAALRGGDSVDRVVVPGRSAESDLLERVRSSDPDVRMPPEGPRLGPAQIDLLRRWIDAGAEWPADAAPREEERPITAEHRAYWAFQPVRKTAPPRVTGAPTAIDAFILDRLRIEGLEPAPEASRLDLIRRVALDLTGLPPSLEEIDAFVGDPSADAFERMVDRVLASPHYGERWGQHWLDVVRFAESEGFEYDTAVAGLWRYRDYVIASLNQDKPFDRFVREQVAGDEIAPDDREHLVAAGFHRLGPVRRNAGNQDVASSRNEVLTDRTDIVGAAFLGVTMGCARCHDHKFDPILQKDYYRLQAFLAATEEHNIPLASTEEQAAWKERTDALKRRIEQEKRRLKDAPDEEKPALRKEIERLEDALPAPLPSIHTVKNSAPTPIHVLRRGEWDRKGDPVGMRFPSVLVSEGAAEMPLSTPRPRSELAGWLTDPSHPLTARVLVNRVWQHHFGRGLVRTSNDFGVNGERPSHPELLDWLAATFVEEGWRLKPLHRRILLSAAYRRSCDPRNADRAAARDPENRWLWRFDRRRLSAEEVRDAMLAASGRLNRKAGGESVFVPVDPELVKALYKPAQWAVTRDREEHYRRSVYLVAKRNLRLPSLAVFDQPALGASCARRESSTHAPQALELLNGRMSNELAAAFAARLEREAGPDAGARVDLAFRLATGRLPAPEERRLAIGFLGDQPLKEFALALFNLNAFLYVR